ncbi:transcription factor bHLH110-like isoform X2 [Cornus florida]|uniref:transcription factor bHLH110-like isoform X2 n=1 Tax=Cornus florida TaxID=4283 RepID=UPI00289E3C5A|nr:transcription factor bHLH110-like isoform X2 [Cornus florida]
MWSGGRILQTDTGSVLMEAIGYIKFLQNQVETLPIYKVIMQQDEQNNARAYANGSARGRMELGSESEISYADGFAWCHCLACEGGGV